MSSKRENLLKRAQSFDLAALGEIYDEYRDPLFRYAYRRVGSVQQAEDFVAETFQKFLDALKRGKGPDEYLQAYLYRIAHNLITKHYQRQPPPPLQLDEDRYSQEMNEPSRIVDKRLKAKKIRKAMQHLTPGQQQVITLKFIEGFSNQEIAQTMNKSIGAVKSQQHRALNSLQRLLLEEENQHE